MQIDLVGQTNLKKLDKFLGIVLIASALVVSLYLIIKANRDLLYPYALFMDERVTYDGIRKILHPDNLIYLFDQIIDGEDHRYGRILWNLSALFSAIPEKLWGSQAQVFSTRMVQAIFQLVSYLLLVFFFTTSWTIRGLGFWVLVTLPETVYFSTMPKPEPIWLFFLSIFLILSFKNSFKFGYHWFFLGIVFATKITAFLIIPIFIILATINLLKDPNWISLPLDSRFLDQNISKKLLKYILIIFGLYQVFGSILIGLKGEQSRIYQLFLKWSDILDSVFKLSIPSNIIILICMIIPFLTGITFLSLPFLIDYLRRNNLNRLSTLLKTLLVFIAGMAVTTPALILKLPKGLLFWLGHSTYSAVGPDLNSKSNQSALETFYSWINFIIHKWTSVQPAVLILIFSLSILIIFFSVTFSIRSIKFNEFISLSFFGKFAEGILFTIAFFLTVPILFKVQRLWPHYLHLGSIFFSLSVLVGCDKLLKHEYRKLLYKRLVIFFLVTFATFYSIGVWPFLLKDMTNALTLLSLRTSTSSYIERSNQYNFLINFFNEEQKRYSNPMVIAFDRSLFVPESTKVWKIEEFNTTMRWNVSHDLVVMDRSYDKKYVNGKMEDHLASSESETCNIKPCYRELTSPYDDLLILKQINSSD